MMKHHIPKPTVISVATEAVQQAKVIAAEVGWAPLAGCAALYLGKIREADKQAGTTPVTNKNRNRQIGRDYEY